MIESSSTSPVPPPGESSLSRSGPWLVALGVSLWATEVAFRIPLGAVFTESTAIVFYEHLIAVLLLMPGIVAHRRELARLSYRSFGYILISGALGSAIATVLYTEALRRGNPTAVNLVLNLQPILTTPMACWLFREKFPPACYPWALLAVLAGLVLSADSSVGFIASLREVKLGAGIGLALVCAVLWSISTVAGRGAAVSISLPLAAGLRVTIGLITITIILFARNLASWQTLWPTPAQLNPGRTLLLLFLLATISGGLPLLIFFAGLQRTKASTAAYFEMLQSPASLVITWGLLGYPLTGYQIVAGVILFLAIVQIRRVQLRYELTS